MDEEAAAKHAGSDNKMNESLGMDGIDIVLEDYSPAAAQNSSEQLQEERKDAPLGGIQAGEKTKWQQWCPWLSTVVLAPYFQVNSKLIGQRVRSSLIPFNRNF